MPLASQDPLFQVAGSAQMVPMWLPCVALADVGAKPPNPPRQELWFTARNQLPMFGDGILTQRERREIFQAIYKIILGP